MSLSLLTLKLVVFAHTKLIVVFAHLIVAPSSSLVARNLRVLVVSHVPWREPGCVAFEYSEEKIFVNVCVCMRMNVRDPNTLKSIVDQKSSPKG